MIKDRLPELLSKLNYFERSQSNLTSSSIDISPYEDTALNEILFEYGEVRILLYTIESNLKEMIKITDFTNFRNTRENELNDIRCENISLGQRLVQKFNKLKLELPNKHDYCTEARMKRGLFYGLYQAYINLWNKHEEYLLSYETKLKKLLRDQTKIINHNSTDEELEEIIANKTTSLFVDNILEDTERERRILRDLIKRFSELRKLEKSIEDVHALFLRIHNLVLVQNDLIQVIELHAQQASIIVDRGAEEIGSANRLKKKSRKKKTCLIVTGIIVLMILILLLAIN